MRFAIDCITVAALSKIYALFFRPTRWLIYWSEEGLNWPHQYAGAAQYGHFFGSAYELNADRSSDVMTGYVANSAIARQEIQAVL